MNAVTKGQEIPDNDDMLIKIRNYHEHEGKNYWIVIKSSNKPLVTIPHLGTKIHGTWQIFDENKELRHALYEKKMSQKEAEELLETCKSNFNDFLNNG